jgi:hypothetical protein
LSEFRAKLLKQKTNNVYHFYIDYIIVILTFKYRVDKNIYFSKTDTQEKNKEIADIIYFGVLHENFLYGHQYI